MPNNLACRADCEAMARAWFGDEVALARDKALDAAAWIADATADDLDDHPKAQAEARAIRDEILALKEPKP